MIAYTINIIIKSLFVATLALKTIKENARK